MEKYSTKFPEKHENHCILSNSVQVFLCSFFAYYYIPTIMIFLLEILAMIMIHEYSIE